MQVKKKKNKNKRKPFYKIEMTKDKRAEILFMAKECNDDRQAEADKKKEQVLKESQNLSFFYLKKKKKSELIESMKIFPLYLGWQTSLLALKIDKSSSDSYSILNYFTFILNLGLH